MESICAIFFYSRPTNTTKRMHNRWGVFTSLWNRRWLPVLIRLKYLAVFTRQILSGWRRRGGWASATWVSFCVHVLYWGRGVLSGSGLASCVNWVHVNCLPIAHGLWGRWILTVVLDRLIVIYHNAFMRIERKVGPLLLLLAFLALAPYYYFWEYQEQHKISEFDPGASSLEKNRLKVGQVPNTHEWMSECVRSWVYVERV